MPALRRARPAGDQETDLRFPGVESADWPASGRAAGEDYGRAGEDGGEVVTAAANGQ